MVSKGAQLVFLTAPFSMNKAERRRCNWLDRFARERNIPHIDLCEELISLKLDSTSDLFDAGHLNFNGATKATLHIGQILRTLYEPTLANDHVKQIWQAECERQKSMLDKRVKK